MANLVEVQYGRRYLIALRRSECEALLSGAQFAVSGWLDRLRVEVCIMETNEQVERLATAIRKDLHEQKQRRHSSPSRTETRARRARIRFEDPDPDY